MSFLPRIRLLEAEVLDIRLHAPFGISGGVHAAANNVLVRLVLEEGTVGHGEAAPLPPYNGETQADALRTIRAAAPAVTALPARASWRDLATDFRSLGGGACGSAQCAFETALLDALLRREGASLWRFFGGAEPSLETDMTVTTGSPAEAEAAARDILSRGIRAIKVKVGGKAGPAHDLARIAKIHGVAPDAPLILDGNAGVSRSDARELVAGLRRLGVTPHLVEQWLAKDDLEGARALLSETGWLVAADESVTSAEAARRIIAAGAARVLNLKLMKAGIAEALDIAAVGRAAGLGLMIGGNVESMLATTTSACFAAGLGGFQIADLDAPLLLAENPFQGGFRLEGGRLHVDGIQAGHGVVPLSPT